MLLIYLCLRNIDINRSIDLVKNANLWLVVSAMAIYVLSFVVRSVRWDYILAPLIKLPFMKSFFFLVFGFFMNNVLPLRLGEFVRAVVAGEKLKISKSGVFATIVVERLADIIIFILIFFMIALFVDIPSWLQKSFLLCAVIFGLMLVVLYFMSKDEQKFVTLISKFHLPEKIFNLVKSLFLKFAGGLKFFQNKKLLFYVFSLSVVVWLIEALSYKVFFMSLGVDVSVMQCLFVIVVTGLGAILPTAPGFVGAIEYMGIISLGIFGIEKSTALACIASVHFANIITTYIMGFTGIIKEKISFSDLFKFAVSNHENGQEEQNEK